MALSLADLQLIIKMTDEASGPLAGMREAMLSTTNSVTQLAEKAGGVGGGFNKMGSDVEGAGQKIREAGGIVGELGKQIGDVAKIALGFDLSRMSFSIADHIEKVMGSFTELGMATHKLQQEIGGTTEQVSGDLAVFERWGLTNEQAAVSLGLLAKNVTTYSDETQKAQSKATGLSGAVDRLGLSFTDASGATLPMDTILLQVADKFAKMPDGIEKTNDAMALFGRSGRDMIPLLNQGAAGLEAARAKAAEYGLVLSEQNVQAAYKFEQAQRDLSEVMKGFAVQVGSLVIPLLTQFLQTVTSLAEGFNTSVLPVIRAVVDYISNTFGPYIQAGLAMVGQGFAWLSQVVSSALSDVLSIVVSVGQAIYDALSWLNPFATHSPSLVSQVADGVAAIQSSYDGVTAIAEPLAKAGESVADFGKRAVASMKSMVSDTKDQLAAVTDALKDAQTQLSNWGKTPIEGTKAFADQLDAITTKEDQVKLRIDQIKLGNDITPQLQGLNEQLKQMQLNAPQSPLGGNKNQMASFQQASRAHQDAIRGINEQINALKTGGAQEDIKGLEDQLKNLGLQADAVKLTEKLQLDPLRKQLAVVKSPTPAEQPFAAILKGMQDAQAQIATLTPQQTKLNDLLKAQQQALSDMSAAATKGAGATKGLGGAAGGLAGTFKDVNKSLEEGKAKLAEWTTKVTEAHDNIVRFADKIIGPVASAFQTLKGYLDPGNSLDLMGALFGPNIGPAVDDIVRRLKGLSTDVGGIIGDITDVIKGKGLNLGDLWKNLSSGAVDLGGLAINIGAALFAALKEAVSKIPWDKVWAEVQNVGQFLIRSLGDISGDIATWLKNQFPTSLASVWGFLKNKGAEVVAALGDIKADILTWFKDQFPKDLSGLFQHQEGTGRDAIMTGLLPTPAMILTGLQHLVSGIDWKGLWSGQSGKGREGVTTGILPSATILTTMLVAEFGKIEWKTVWASATKMGAGLGASGLSITADLDKFLADQFGKIEWGPIWKTATDLMKDFRAAVEPISVPLSIFVGLLGTATLSLLAVNVAGLATNAWLTAQSLALGVAESAWAAFNVVVALNPLTKVLLVVTAMTIALVTLYETNNTFRDNVDKAWNNVQTTIQGVIDTLTKSFHTFVDDLNAVAAAVSRLNPFASKVPGEPGPSNLNPLPKAMSVPTGGSGSGISNGSGSDKVPTNNVTITQQFYGNPNPSDVGSASQSGVTQALNQKLGAMGAR